MEPFIEYNRQLHFYLWTIISCKQVCIILLPGLAWEIRNERAVQLVSSFTINVNAW